jgi:crossover junction endodeoxyribonuclease RusA
MKRIVITVQGRPSPAGSKKAFAIKKGGMYTGRTNVVDTSGAAGRDWRALLQDRAASAMEICEWEKYDGPVSLAIAYTYKRPKAHYRANGEVKANVPAYPICKPDLTKLTRAVEDAFTGIIWKDDSQVVAKRENKVYGPEWSTLIVISKVV